MERIRQSFSWWCFENRGLTPRQLAQTAAAIGYEAVDLVSEEHWPVLREHGLAIAAINGHQSIGLGLNRRDQHERITAEIGAQLRQCMTWRIPNLIVFSGNRAGLDDNTGAEITAEGLRRVATAAEDAGVTLVLELLNSKVDHPDYQADRTAWGAEVVRLVGSPRVKLLYDIYHMQIMEGDIIRTIQRNAALIGHYHTAGVPGRHEIGADQELQYGPIMRAIQATGYEGFVGQELIPSGEPAAALREAFTICDVAE